MAATAAPAAGGEVATHTPVDQLRRDPVLLAACVRATLQPLLQKKVPEEWRDANGHVNIRHYMALFDDLEWEMAREWGLSDAHFKNGLGLFDLEHHVKYLREVHIGDSVSAFYRILGVNRTPPLKRVHFMVYLANDTNGCVAATCEGVCCASNLTTRASTPFPEKVANQIRRIGDQHAKLNWECPHHGSLDPR